MLQYCCCVIYYVVPLMSFFSETNKLRLGGIAKTKTVLAFMHVWTDNFAIFSFSFPSLIVVAWYNWGSVEISWNLLVGVFLEQTVIQDKPNKQHQVVFFLKTGINSHPLHLDTKHLGRGEKDVNCLRCIVSWSQNSAL